MHSMDMVDIPGVRQIIHHDFGRSKDFFAPSITALEYLQDGSIRLRRIEALRKCLMPVGIKQLPHDLVRLNSVLVE